VCEVHGAVEVEDRAWWTGNVIALSTVTVNIYPEACQRETPGEKVGIPS
jgi:hypothetical protein